MKNNHYQSILKFIVTGFGSGYSKKAPGTAGTLCCLIILCISDAFLLEPSIFEKIFLTIVIFLVGTFCLSELKKQGEFSTDHDPGYVVIDEFAGLLTAVSFIEWTNISLFMGFILFRFFDILKPWPISIVDKRVGPFWVMADDIVAGLLAGLILMLLF